MYKATLSFTTKNYDIRKNQIIDDSLIAEIGITEAEITEYLNIGYLVEYDGTLEITENGVYDVEDYQQADVDVAGGQATLQEQSVTITTNKTEIVTPETGYDGLSKVTITTNVILKVPDGMRFGYSSVLPNEMDTSECTNMGSFFYGCGSVTTIPLIDTSSATRMESMFRQCSSLREVPLIVTSNATKMEGMFRDCTSLKDVPALNANSANSMQYMFLNCNQLTNESLNNILYLCTTVGATYTRPKTLSELGLSQAQATTCQTLSNYQDFVDAGWTTGY